MLLFCDNGLPVLCLTGSPPLCVVAHRFHSCIVALWRINLLSPLSVSIAAVLFPTSSPDYTYEYTHTAKTRLRLCSGRISGRLYFLFLYCCCRPLATEFCWLLQLGSGVSSCGKPISCLRRPLVTGQLRKSG